MIPRLLLEIILSITVIIHVMLIRRQSSSVLILNMAKIIVRCATGPIHLLQVLLRFIELYLRDKAGHRGTTCEHIWI